MSNATPALTLAHLAPYFPYHLKMHNSDGVFTLDGYSNEIGYYLDTTRYGANAIPEDTRPILRPMTDLTKQIYHGGRTFIPAKVLWNVSAKQEDLFDIYGTIPDYWKSCMGEHPFSHEYRTVRRLFEWHFDVFGLLDQGLAISYKEAGL